MQDIVNRLRAEDTATTRCAADEIEQLRGIRDELERTVDTLHEGIFAGRERRYTWLWVQTSAVVVWLVLMLATVFCMGAQRLS